MSRDTIFALSSGAVPAGVAVIRLSGPKAADVMNQIIDSEPKPRMAALRYVTNPKNGDVIDQALVLYFPGSKSFTGEESVEFHLHGGRAVVKAMIDLLGSFDGCRMAEAGEFSRRGFENGKFDLTAVEGLADLIHAETENQRKQAMRQASGAHKSVIDGWREILLYARSMIEAELDFSDEEDVPGAVSDVIWPKLQKLKQEMEHHLSYADRGERLRNGLTVVLAGHPNAGKSSLLNWFAKRDVAIVTEEAGTTRDLLELHLDIEGFPVTVIDTAGLRDSSNIVEQEGIRRALEKSENADLLIEVVDGSAPNERVALASRAQRLVLFNKQDRIGSEMINSGSNKNAEEKVFSVSLHTGFGMDGFYDSFVKQIEELFSGAEDVLITRKRHEAYFRQCVDNVDKSLIYTDSPLEIRSEYLRMAGDELGKITGRIDVEDMLGVIFSQFCVGK
ncbi:tRNA uridine-5-carboxymethylaminomethyl(34) synthesis GTPase MnmE [Cohaesibacter celericrescens]|uniref:tRNA modification GTPase MnmE n=1 Tax=Cohaesibacter celericrescens TaxID=2067669 RepID=A0A2N5XPZ2_9HYPH|nr:tRNA uridine-5-carboxymethylaminomethyl(34) synthesis GTPase MnmE [Cohaesibacter celericrescens]PLW76488.1 tRNA uridine-5-carboxymethylaminomethyl(34) synthesis GTPase MnmE [Cohaesibacter celericrescens]